MSYGGHRLDQAWVDEAAQPDVLDRPVDGPALRQLQESIERRQQAAVLDAMDKAAQAGLGNRGRIRAGERALARVNRQIQKEASR